MDELGVDVGCGGSPEVIVDKYMSVVRAIARGIHRRLPPGYDIESLVQSGVVGLLEAAKRYKIQSDSSFACFASRRIKGEMIEYLRALDWVSRSVRSWGRRTESARVQLLAMQGREPSTDELAAVLGLTTDRYFRIERKLDGAKVEALEEQDANKESIREWTSRGFLDPAKEAENREIVAKLPAAIERLTKREQLIVNLYYQEGKTLLEIGGVIGKTQGRVSQILHGAVAQLRATLL